MMLSHDFQSPVFSDLSWLSNIVFKVVFVFMLASITSAVLLNAYIRSMVYGKLRVQIYLIFLEDEQKILNLLIIGSFHVRIYQY